MVSKSQIKLITSLQQKKYRNINGLFVAEGIKVIDELLRSGVKLHYLYATEENLFEVGADRFSRITETELKKISLLKTPNKAVALFKIPDPGPIVQTNLIVALDDVRDPGNLGTIIRLCDWFGVKNLLCSEETVDCYNPKVVQATMGSLSRVHVSYVNLTSFLSTTNLPVFVADMEGENIYKATLPQAAVLVFGNEANGISKEIKEMAKNKLTVPRFGAMQQTESLNVATATAVLLSEFRRGV